MKKQDSLWQKLWQRRALRWSGVVLALPLLTAVSAYAVTEPVSQTLKAQTAKKVEILPALTVQQASEKSSYWTEEAVQEGETIRALLGRLGLERDDIAAVLSQRGINSELKQLRAGQMFSVRFDETGQASDIQFFNDDDNGERNLIALEQVDGKWRASTAKVALETLPTLRSVVVRSSASGSLAQAGVGVALREALRDIFSERVSIDGLQEGDQIRLLYDTLYFRGQEIATGDILAAEVVKNGKTYSAYFYDQGDDGGSYFDAKGKPLKDIRADSFNFQPVQNARISSPYGMRVHPIFGTVRMHTGIDYAAPSGTPVYAPADGIISFKGWKGGYGHTVMMRHSNGVETLYAHLSAFSPANGAVRAGEVIGFVGSSGNSTGPHLHYEARINGSPVNPTTAALPAPKAEKVNMTAFRKQQAKADNVLAAVRGLPVTVARLY
ncbi:MAG: peptidoglycan DD-metalloendopeptidase family protein [Neisseria sp.]|nr:peptidoglycan DD-metalloendopeptidase family protein [Neisseria sp.]